MSVGTHGSFVRSALLAGALISLVAGCPDPTRAPATTTVGSVDGGRGGHGGDGGHASGGHGVGGGGAADPRVPCTPTGTPCAVGDVCCVGRESAGCDHCAAGACGVGADAATCDVDDYYVLACAAASQCPGTRCCGMPDPSGGFSRPLVGARCADTCTALERVLCADAIDCPDGQLCVPLAYPGYRICK
jgi:hypothetical protein